MRLFSPNSSLTPFVQLFALKQEEGCKIEMFVLFKSLHKGYFN